MSMLSWRSRATVACAIVVLQACGSGGGGGGTGSGGSGSPTGGSGGRGGSSSATGGSGSGTGGSTGGSAGGATGGAGVSTGGAGGSAGAGGGSGGATGTGGTGTDGPPAGTGGTGGMPPQSCGSWKPGYTGPLLGRCNQMMPGCPLGKCGIEVSKGSFLSLDDFEGAPVVATPTAPAGIRWASRDGRTGSWTPVFPAGLTSVKLEVARTDTAGGSPNSTQAIHFTGGPAMWSPTLLLPMGSNCYDASAYGGITFWMKGAAAAGNNKVKFSLHTPVSEPIANGGVCVDNGQCYSHFAKIVDVTPGWTKYTIPWSDFAMTWCATPTPPIPQGFEPHKMILAMSFSPVDNMKGFDFWVDDMTFDIAPDSRDTFEKIVTKPLFDAFFPTPKAPASHQGLIDAVKKYGSKWGGPLGGDGDITQRKHEAAAFLGQITQETGSLIDVVEKVPTMPPYHGRGAIQLTGLANYQAAQAAGFADIVTSPNKVVESADYLFGTAIWFWTTLQSGGAGVCHQAIMQGNYGQTTRIINGIECSNPPPATQQNRVKYYQEFAAAMGINAHTSRLFCP